jgi:hypothetical protein
VACSGANQRGDLREVVAQVHDVVGHDVVEGVAGVAGVPDMGQSRGIEMLDDVGEVAVEGGPEDDEIGPRAGCIVIAGDPLVLLLAGKLQLG